MNKILAQLPRLINWGIKFLFLILPWQTLYIVRIAQTPFENVVLHGSLLLVFLIVVGALLLHPPKLSWLFIIFTIIPTLAVLHASNSLLALQQVIWLGLGFGLWWILCHGDYISKHELFTYTAIGATLPAIFGLWQFVMQTSVTSTWLGLSFVPRELPGATVIVNESGRWLRAFGTFPHPNIFGGYLVGALVFIFLQTENSFKNNYWWRLAIVLFSSVLVLTFSRSALIVWVLFIVYFWYQHLLVKKSREFLARINLSVLVVFIMFVVTWPIWSGRLGQGGMSANETVAINERVNGLEIAGNILKKHWVLGVGPGNYVPILRTEVPTLHNWELTPVHAVPVLIAAEWGIIGVLLIGALWYYWRYSALFLLPILLLDHYLYSTWPGILVGIILILSTVYTHRGLTEPKNYTTYPH